MKWNSYTDMGGTQGIKRALERDIAHNSNAINVAIQGAFQDGSAICWNGKRILDGISEMPQRFCELER